MGKNPAFLFYPGDWIQDTRPLSLAAKGAWIDLLCAMWRSQTKGSLTLSIVGYSRLIGATVDQTTSVIKELTDLQICDTVTLCNGDVTLINRRMMKEEKERISTRFRVKRYRNNTEKRDCNANVTPPSSVTASVSVTKAKLQGGEADPKKQLVLEKLKEAFLKFSDSRYQHSIKIFVEANYNKNPDAVAYCLNQLINNKEPVRYPKAYLEKILGIENGNYNERESIQEHIIHKADIPVQDIPRLGEVLKVMGVR